MTEHEISFNRISQEFLCRGARHEQLRLLVHNTILSRMEDLNARFAHQGEWMATVDRERDRLAHEVCNSIGAFIDDS